jgi:outer membrane protein assembly factor BamB
MHKIRLPFLLLIVLTLMGCSRIKNEQPATDAALTYPPIALTWTYERQADTVVSVAGDYAFVGEGKQGLLLTANLSTRKPAWTATYFTGSNPDQYLQRSIDLLRTEVVHAQGHYFARLIDEQGSAVQVLDTQGRRVRVFRTPSKSTDISVSLRVIGDRLYVPNAQDLRVYRLGDLVSDAPTVEPVWAKHYPSLDSLGGDGGVPVLDALDHDPTLNRLYVALSDDDGTRKALRVVAYDLDGTERWQRTVWQEASGRPGSLAVGNLASRDGRVIVQQSMGRFMAFDAEGEKLWERASLCPTGGTTGVETMVIEDGRMYTTPMGDSCITAWDVRTGELVWNFEADGPSFMNEFALVRGVLYAANGRLWALDLKTGKVLAASSPELAQQLRGSALSAGTVRYDAPRDQLILWGRALWAFKPIR